MSAIALLLATTVLGVDYGWQPAADGQLEYIVQIEPVTLIALRDGRDVISNIDPDMRNIRRFRLRVGTDVLPRQGSPPAAQVPGVTATELSQAGVRYGWQPLDAHQMEFMVQLSPERLILLQNGQELAGLIPVEAQNVARIRVRSGDGPLPQQALPRESTELSGESESSIPRGERAELEPPGPATDPEGGALPPAPREQSAGLGPPASQFPQDVPGQRPGSQYDPPPVGDRAAGESQIPSRAESSRLDRVAPGERSRSWPENPPPQRSRGDPSRFEERFETWPGPEEDPPAFPERQAGGRLWHDSDRADGQPGSDPPDGRRDPTLPAQPSRSPPDRDRVGTASLPPGERPASYEAAPPRVPIASEPPAPFRPGDARVYPPLPWEAVLAGTDRSSRVRRIGQEFWSELAATAREPSLDYLRTEGATVSAADSERPWGPLAFALTFLFASLGANLYLTWIAMDMYRRYLDLADDLREPGTPRINEEEGAFEDEEDEDAWGTTRRRRHRRRSLAA